MFLFGRAGWDTIRATLIISGAFGLFHRETTVHVGGYSTETVGEDMELVVRMHRRLRDANRSYHIRFIPGPVGCTEVPSTLGILGKQRERWQRGLTETMVRHQRTLLNYRYGRIGLIAYPFYYFLETFGPVLEFLGYVLFLVALALGVLSVPFVLTFFLIAFVVGLILSLCAVAMEQSFSGGTSTNGILFSFFFFPSSKRSATAS